VNLVGLGNLLYSATLLLSYAGHPSGCLVRASLGEESARKAVQRLVLVFAILVLASPLVTQIRYADARAVDLLVRLLFVAGTAFVGWHIGKALERRDLRVIEREDTVGLLVEVLFDATELPAVARAER
jgi:hypothetical protein